MSWKLIPRATKKEARRLGARLRRYIRHEHQSAYDVGEALYLIMESRAYEHLGFSTFDACAKSLPLSPRTIDNRLAIYRKFVRDLGLTKQQLGRLAPTKAVVLLRVATKANIDEWIEKAEQTNEKGLIRLVQRALGRYRKVRKRVLFHVWPKDENLVHEAINLVKRRRGLEHTGDALVEIMRRAVAKLRGGAA